jgi:hypothetical protein
MNRKNNGFWLGLVNPETASEYGRSRPGKKIRLSELSAHIAEPYLKK